MHFISCASGWPLLVTQKQQINRQIFRPWSGPLWAGSQLAAGTDCGGEELNVSSFSNCDMASHSMPAVFCLLTSVALWCDKSPDLGWPFTDPRNAWINHGFYTQCLHHCIYRLTRPKVFSGQMGTLVEACPPAGSSRTLLAALSAVTCLPRVDYKTKTKQLGPSLPCVCSCAVNTLGCLPLSCSGSEPISAVCFRGRERKNTQQSSKAA